MFSTKLLQRLYKSLTRHSSKIYSPNVQFQLNEQQHINAKEKILMKWLMLLLAIVLEACGTTSMKLSNGFANFVPSVLMFVLYGASLVVLDVALKQIPVGIAYAIWSGLGIVIISSIDAFYFKESLSLQQILFILLILVGVAGLNLSSLHSRTR